MEVFILANEKNKKSGVDREEYGYGFDISVDDLGVIGQNNKAKKQNNNENKEVPKSKNNPSILNE